MSTQIAIRLPDEMVAFLDHTVATGKAPSRTALVASAVEREMRRLAASLDNVLTVPVGALGRTVRSLSAAQEAQLVRAVVLAYGLEVPLLT